MLSHGMVRYCAIAWHLCIACAEGDVFQLVPYPCTLLCSFFRLKCLARWAGKNGPIWVRAASASLQTAAAHGQVPAKMPAVVEHDRTSPQRRRPRDPRTQPDGVEPPRPRSSESPRSPPNPGHGRRKMRPAVQGLGVYQAVQRIQQARESRMPPMP